MLLGTSDIVHHELTKSSENILTQTEKKQTKR